MSRKLMVGDIVEITRVSKEDAYPPKQMKGRKVKIDHHYDSWDGNLKGYKAFAFEGVDGKLPTHGFFYAVRVKRIS